MTSTYVQAGPGEHKGYEYSRTQNPTRQALEGNLAALEGGRCGLAFASGCAATTTILHMLRAGDHVVAGDDLYGGTYRIFERVMKQMGIEVTYVDPTQPDRVRRGDAPDDEAGLGGDADQSAAEAVRHRRRRRPVQEARRLARRRQHLPHAGAAAAARARRDHGRALDDEVSERPRRRRRRRGHHAATTKLRERLAFLQNAIGAVPSPMDCFLVLRGTKTLHVRMERHVENARKVAALARGACRRREGDLPGPEVAPAARARRAADARAGRHDHRSCSRRQEAGARARARDAARRRSSSPAPSRSAASSR